MSTDPLPVQVRPYDSEDQSQVIALWSETIGDVAPHNDPLVAIRLKQRTDPELFLVAVIGDTVVGTVMGGFDGHRGWIYSLAVSPLHRRCGIATALVAEVERALRDRGCMKANLQVREGNWEAIEFYKRAGYSVEDRVSMGKRLYGEGID